MPIPRGPHSDPETHRLYQTLEGYLDEKPGVSILGVSDSGLGSDVTLTFKANRHTPYVYVHVQSSKAGEGGESYDTANFTSETRYNTQSDKRQTVTITRDDDEHYYAYVVPAAQIPPGCGSYTLFDGVDVDDFMEFADLGKRTVSEAELEANVLSNLVEEDQKESDFDSDGTLEGRLELTVITGKTVDIEFYTRQGHGTTWTTAGTHSSKSSGDVVTQDVDLVEGKLSFIAYKILEDGTTDSLGRAVRAFDPDKIAQMRHLGLSLNGGTLKAEAAGDSDTAKIYLTRTLDGSEPSDPTSVNADQTIAARAGEVTFSGTLALDSTARVKARGENSNGVLAPTDTILADSIQRAPQDPAPQVDAQTSQSGSTGTLDLDIYDENLAVTAIEFQKKTGSGDFSGTWVASWDSSSGTKGTDKSLTRSESITLRKKHNVSIKWKLTYTDTHGNSQTIANTHEFDVDEVPEVKFTGSVDGSLNVITSGVADEDTATVYVTVTTDGTEPNDPTSSNADETIDVSTSKVWGSVDTDIDASFADVVRMKARGETSGGTLAGTDFIEETSFKVEDPPPPAVDIDSFTAFDDGADIDYTVNFTPSSNVTDADNSVEATFIGVDGTVAATATESSPQTNNQITATDSGAGDGSSATDDWHKAELELLDSGGSTIETKTTRTIESV